MRSKWTHSICDDCWNINYLSDPCRIIDPEPEKCCFCGKEHSSGIFIRKDPKQTPCKGNHE